MGFIGAGKVGFSLGRYLINHNITVSGYLSKTIASSKEAASFTKTKAFQNYQELLDESDIIIITTPDEKIIEVGKNLKKFNIKNKIIVHCSGSLSSQIFSDTQKKGAYFSSLHPMFPICDRYNSYKLLKDAIFTLEGDPEAVKVFKEIFKKLPNEYLIISSENKKLYHLANVTVSNLYLALINKACSYLENCGIPEEEALKALYPLMETNLINLKEKGIVEALTGPLERNDLLTIKGHVEVIPEEDLTIYGLLSKELLNIAEEKNPSRNYSNIKKFLEGTLP